MTTFDASTLRSVLGSFATGVVVVTTMDAGAQPVGVTANSFSSVSLDPPLVSWCLRRDSYSLAAFRSAGCFVINVLGADHASLCRCFALAGADKWHGVAFGRGELGCPVLEDSIATLECRLAAEHEAGDHVILIGEVGVARAVDGRHPLIFYRGGYYGLRGGQAAPALPKQMCDG